MKEWIKRRWGNRPTHFKTDDGFVLAWDPKRRVWTDGDLVFLSDRDGYPLNDQGTWLEGVPVSGREIEE